MKSIGRAVVVALVVLTAVSGRFYIENRHATESQAAEYDHCRIQIADELDCITNTLLAMNDAASVAENSASLDACLASHDARMEKLSELSDYSYHQKLYRLLFGRENAAREQAVSETATLALNRCGEIAVEKVEELKDLSEFESISASLKKIEGLHAGHKQLAQYIERLREYVDEVQKLNEFYLKLEDSESITENLEGLEERLVSCTACWKEFVKLSTFSSKQQLYWKHFSQPEVSTQREIAKVLEFELLRFVDIVVEKAEVLEDVPEFEIVKERTRDYIKNCQDIYADMDETE